MKMVRVTGTSRNSPPEVSLEKKKNNYAEVCKATLLKSHFGMGDLK